MLVEKNMLMEEFSMNTKGLLMFAKYALPPNILSYCGPSDNKILFQVLSKGEPQKNDLAVLLLKFEGAVPYLKFIASNNGISDLFDFRVVEAYWLGNKLLEKIRPQDMYSAIKERFFIQIKKQDWDWLSKESLSKAKPFHAFQVFEIYRRTGFLKLNAVSDLMKTINNCRIGWGMVIDNIPDESGRILVEHIPLIFNGNKIIFGEKIQNFFYFDELVQGLIKKGDFVSMHWDWVCEKITCEQMRNLSFWTKYHLDIANKTM